MSDALIRLPDSFDRKRIRKSRTGGHYVSVGPWGVDSVDVPVTKVRGRWMVDRAALGDAVATTETKAAALRASLVQADRDYDARKLAPEGVSTKTTWGAYVVRGNFRLESGTSTRGSSYGEPWSSWLCNSCWKPARIENNNEECHRCRDWSPCGTDCTMSDVCCDACGFRRSTDKKVVR